MNCNLLINKFDVQELNSCRLRMYVCVVVSGSIGDIVVSISHPVVRLHLDTIREIIYYTKTLTPNAIAHEYYKNIDLTEQIFLVNTVFELNDCINKYSRPYSLWERFKYWWYS